MSTAMNATRPARTAAVRRVRYRPARAVLAVTDALAAATAQAVGTACATTFAAEASGH
ncbi:hypothetical protein [Peterkaempfera sp. SMS 1(5)a]|uniref:hypothetical protein n=1 Tax=Peterkaempfera podocarpi TaxID=3232308 RepID=UPI00367079C2